MDFADDVAYCVNDVEDAIVGGWLEPDRVLDARAERARFAELVGFVGRDKQAKLLAFTAILRSAWTGTRAHRAWRTGAMAAANTASCLTRAWPA